jgi:hypothetical protein
MDLPTTSDPSQFTHIRILLSMVVSLSIARLLSGLAKFVQHPGKLKVYPLHLIWTAFMLLMLIHFWWWEFSLSHLPQWYFFHFVFLLAYAALLYLMSSLLFPDSIAEYEGYREYFMLCRKWFFGILAATLLMDVVDTWIKGSQHLLSYGTEYWLRCGIGVTLCLVAMRVENQRFHLIFAIGALVYNISWILRLYDLLA